MNAPTASVEATATTLDLCSGPNCFPDDAELSFDDATAILQEKGIEASPVECRARCALIGHCTVTGMDKVANLDLSGGRGGYDREPGVLVADRSGAVLVNLPRANKLVKVGAKSRVNQLS